MKFPLNHLQQFKRQESIHTKTYETDSNIPDHIQDLIDFLMYFEDANPRILIRTTFSEILYEGRVKDFDVIRIKDFPISLNYRLYSANVEDNHLIIRMQKLQ